MPDSVLKEIFGQSRIGLLPFFKGAPFSGGQRIKTLEFFAHGLSHFWSTGRERDRRLPGIH
ncbi:MAG: hypothetical protein QFX35_06125 [Candidatus Verstraetearchaeota archaeon]|nr:hypothetical protein [Candidatus Verstraetearchaeota archaeon]